MRNLLGKYRLLHKIGQGGYGQVYLGFHLLLEVTVAVKLLRLAPSQEECAFFLEEARSLARLEHPSIIRVRDFDIDEGLPFLVMDYAVILQHIVAKLSAIYFTRRAARYGSSAGSLMRQ